MMLWVVVLRASETKIRCIFSHSSTIRRGVEFPAGLEQHVAVLPRMLEAVEGLADLRLDIAIARRELIAEDMQQGKIDLVGAMRIRRMHVRLDLGAVVEQEIEHVVALMLVGADDLALTGMWLATSV